MNALLKMWRRIPIWIQCIIIGIGFLVPMVSVIQVLIIENVKRMADVPIAFVLTLPILWVYTKWLIGKKPFKLSDIRQELSLVTIPPGLDKRWLPLLIIVMILFVASAVSVGFSFSTELSAQQEFINFFKSAPPLTAVLLLGVLALTAGVVEEIVFRGYIQGMMEKRYGIVTAILFTGVFFVLVHFLPINLLLAYFLVSFMFSYVAYKLRTVTPGIIAHAAFDYLGFLLVYFGSYIGSQEYFDDYTIINTVIATITLTTIIFISQRMSRPSFVDAQV